VLSKQAIYEERVTFIKAFAIKAQAEWYFAEVFIEGEFTKFSNNGLYFVDAFPKVLAHFMLFSWVYSGY